MREWVPLAVSKFSFTSQISDRLAAIHRVTDEPEVLEPLKGKLEQHPIVLGIISQDG
jgi:hypothetical protein